MLSLEQKSAVIERVQYFVDLGNDKLDTFLDMPYVRFDKRGTTGATACYSTLELDFNAGLMVDNWDEYINQVIPHEVAHLLKSHFYGEDRKGRMHSPHGVYWQQIMRRLGVNPDRTHRMDTSKVAMPKAKHIYVCEGCQKEIVLSSVRHNKMRRGTRTYSHSPCKGFKLVHKKALGKMTHSEARDHTTPAVMKKAALKAAPKKSKAPKKGTKIARALVAYNAAKSCKPTITRQEMISVLVDLMNCDRKAAAGYFQNCKKKVG